MQQFQPTVYSATKIIYLSFGASFYVMQLSTPDGALSVVLI